MIYKVGLKGYALVEADSKKEALNKADMEDYIEETIHLTTVKPCPEASYDEEEGVMYL